MEAGGTTASQGSKTTRRRFLKTSTAAVAGGFALGGGTLPNVHAAEDSTLRIGLVGAGGRGTGAAVQALTADPNTILVAIGEAFDDRLQGRTEELSPRVLAHEKRALGPHVIPDEDQVHAGLSVPNSDPGLVAADAG